MNVCDRCGKYGSDRQVPVMTVVSGPPWPWKRLCYLCIDQMLEAGDFDRGEPTYAGREIEVTLDVRDLGQWIENSFEMEQRR